MLVYDVCFQTTEGKTDYTQVDVEPGYGIEGNTVDFINVILSLQEEMKIQKIIDITYVGDTEDEEYQENLKEEY